MKKPFVKSAAPGLGALAATMLAACVFSLAAADGTLRTSPARVTVDGTVKPEEYTYFYEAKGIRLSLARSETSLYAGVTADTQGWVGIGFKSDKMNKAEILIGYFRDGRAEIFEQTGAGHGHSNKKIPYLKRYAMTESGKSTRLEVELDARELVKEGQKSLLFIIAYGGDDTATSYHKARAGVEVKLGN